MKNVLACCKELLWPGGGRSVCQVHVLITHGGMVHALTRQHALIRIQLIKGPIPDTRILAEISAAATCTYIGMVMWVWCCLLIMLPGIRSLRHTSLVLRP